MNALIIDDDPITHELITAFFRRFAHDHQIDAIDIRDINDSIKGILELTDHGSKYDVILLDIKLPKLGGDEIYKQIGMKTPDLLNRIIIITSSPHELYKKLPDQDVRVLGKPFRYDMFEFQVADVYSPRNMNVNRA